MNRLGLVLFNLGGPDGPESVKPFLFNLFNDPAIIGAPTPIRWLLAKWLSSKRAPVARDIYAKIGGGSPILANTAIQARALAEELRDLGPVQVEMAMRYWHPRADAAAARLKAAGVDKILLLPLYPQFSTTTTGSAFKEWREAAARVGLDVATVGIGCYPTEPGFVAAMASRIRPALDRASSAGQPRLLFSAHGLPKTVIRSGDPYQWQVERSAEAIAKALGPSVADWVVCFQSRVGPLEWIGPATDAEIERAGRDGVPVVLAPIAFVSEHSETLVELDIEYRELARQVGVPHFERVPTVSADPAFIAGLAALVRARVTEAGGIHAGGGRRQCPEEFGRCGCGG
ncbi:MAG: ferrochelatase [Alphaproteobacteria bacterium]